MNYCLPYKPNKDFSNENIKELLVTYNSRDLTLPDFLAANQNKTIILDIPSTEVIDHQRMEALYEKYGNFKMRFSSISAFKEMRKEWEHSIPSFPLITEPVTLTSIKNLLDLKTSDIYIFGELAFSLKDLRSLCEGTSIRTVPNICKSEWENEPDCRRFWIAPEHLFIYEPYIDIIEFAGAASVYYLIYSRGKWFGNLKECIIGMTDDIDSRSLVPAFANYRLNCHKSCLMNPNACHLCDAAASLARTMAEQSVMWKEQ